MPRDLALRAAILVLLSGLPACDADTTEPDSAPAPELVVETQALHLGFQREGRLELRNDGDAASGPIAIRTAPVRAPAGSILESAEVVAEPAEISSLEAEASVEIAVRVRLPAGIAVSGYSSAVTVSAETVEIEVPVDFAVKEASVEEVATVSVEEAPATVRRGTVATLLADVRDADGQPLEGAPLSWSTIPADAIHVAPGRFVALETGTIRIVAKSGEAADTAEVTVTPREVAGGEIQVEATAGPPDRVTSDLWVHGDVAYTGTWHARPVLDQQGNALFVWDVSDPLAPTLADSVIVDARVVNDIKVSADGRIGVLTHEGSADQLNGISILDLSDPLHPEVVSRFTLELTSGVHNTWIDGDHVYVVADGFGGGLRVVNISDPTEPRLVSGFYAGTSILHDVYVRNGLAFLAHWNAGLVILDVGNGMAGGSPEDPREVSRISSLGGETHNAWYWPEAGYVFVGEEDFDAEDPGIMHVVDVQDLESPREVATFSVPGDPPHNFWLDEERAVLYMAWYGQGIRALDVGGELLGPLDRQGRQIAAAVYGPEGACPPSTSAGTCTWAPQLHGGTLFLADMTLGLVVASPPL